MEAARPYKSHRLSTPSNIFISVSNPIAPSPHSTKDGHYFGSLLHLHFLEGRDCFSLYPLLTLLFYDFLFCRFNDSMGTLDFLYTTLHYLCFGAYELRSHELHISYTHSLQSLKSFAGKTWFRRAIGCTGRDRNRWTGAHGGNGVGSWLADSKGGNGLGTTLTNIIHIPTRRAVKKTCTVPPKGDCAYSSAHSNCQFK